MKKVVAFSDMTCCCPICGYLLTVGTSVRIKGEPRQQHSLDDDQADAVKAHLASEEAERHG